MAFGLPDERRPGLETAEGWMRVAALPQLVHPARVEDEAVSSPVDVVPLALQWWRRTAWLLSCEPQAESNAATARPDAGGWVAVNSDAPADRRVNTALAPVRCADPVGWLEHARATHRESWPCEVGGITTVWTAGVPAVLVPPQWRARRLVAGVFTGFRHAPVARVSVRPCADAPDGSHVDRIAAGFEQRMGVWRGTRLRACVSASFSSYGVWLRLSDHAGVTPSERVALLAAAGFRWSAAGPVGVVVDERDDETLHRAGFTPLGVVWRLTAVER